MKILVLGATGNSGERVVRRLIAEGHTVRFLSRRNSSDPVVGELVALGAEYIQGSAADSGPAANGCDALIGCAHIRHAGMCIKTGIRRYIQLSSTRRHTRFPCASSAEVIEGERIIEQGNLDHAILRPTMIYGGRDDRNFSRVQNWFRRHSWAPLIGDGRNLLQPIHTDDVVNAIIASLNNPQTTARKSFDIAGPEPITFRAFLEMAAASVGVARPRFIRVPLSLALTFAPLIPKISREQIQRLAEDKSVSIEPARAAFDFTPRPFPFQTPNPKP